MYQVDLDSALRLPELGYLHTKPNGKKFILHGLHGQLGCDINRYRYDYIKNYEEKVVKLKKEINKIWMNSLSMLGLQPKESIKIETRRLTYTFSWDFANSNIYWQVHPTRYVHPRNPPTNRDLTFSYEMDKIAGEVEWRKEQELIWATNEKKYKNILINYSQLKRINHLSSVLSSIRYAIINIVVDRYMDRYCTFTLDDQLAVYLDRPSEGLYFFPQPKDISAEVHGFDIYDFVSQCENKSGVFKHITNARS